MKLTQERRRELLDDAIDAVRAYYAYLAELGPVVPEGWPVSERVKPDVKRQELYDSAIRAVTKAVTEGEHIHTLISVGVGCPGMRIVDLIDDRDAYAKALVVERNAAENYHRQIMDATRVEALRRLGGEEKQVIAERLNIARPTLNEWEKKSSQDA